MDFYIFQMLHFEFEIPSSHYEKNTLNILQCSFNVPQNRMIFILAETVAFLYRMYRSF